MIRITGTLGTAFAVVLTSVVILFMFMVAKSIYKFFIFHFLVPSSTTLIYFYYNTFCTTHASITKE